MLQEKSNFFKDMMPQRAPGCLCFDWQQAKREELRPKAAALVQGMMRGVKNPIHIPKRAADSFTSQGKNGIIKSNPPFKQISLEDTPQQYRVEGDEPPAVRTISIGFQ